MTNDSEEDLLIHGEDGANSQADILSPHSTGNDSEQSGDYFYPFTSKTMAMGFILLRTLRPVSERIGDFALKMCKEIDPCSPSIYQVKSVRLPGFTEPTKCNSGKGIPFFVNFPSTIVRKCLGTPRIADNIQRLPVYSSEGICEIYEARRWHEDPKYHAPMITHNGKQVFIGDIVSMEATQDTWAKIMKFEVEVHKY
ncbi:uncharacterized protein LOC135338525 [Halichondria panicea]|uniref:uncharacterized protein LOC135338525 n=1 Tax=Halichondria panicea TaxID=6063 RepID=UPI00312B4006